MDKKKRKQLTPEDSGSTRILQRMVPPSRDPRKIPALIILRGKDTGRIIKLDRPSVSIGRDKDADISLSDQTVSRKHCLLIDSSSGKVIVDLQSSNGTFVDGSRVERSPLKNGDKISIGESVLRFEMADSDVSEYHEKVYQQITFDELTSLYNRKSMLRELKLRFSAMPKSLPFSLLFMDIDHFKQVNDTHGHITGSKILADLGRILLSNLRSNDLPCRYGGEEFVMIISQSRAEEAVFVAEKIREMVKQRVFTSHKDEPVVITVSIGVAEATMSYRDFQELIDRADAAMYQAKKNGRNRSVLYRPGASPPYVQIR